MAAPALAYPKPRKNRGTGAPGTAGAIPGASVPGVHLWPFECVAGSGLCSVAVSAEYQGMAVVTDAEVMLAHTNATSAVRFDLLICDDNSGAREGSVTFSKPNGTSIFDPAQYADPNDADDGHLNQLTMVGAQAFTTVRRLPARIPVIKSRFFLKAYAVGNGGATLNVQGFVRVVTGLFEDELANFL
jgi:hypothetical protein